MKTDITSNYAIIKGNRIDLYKELPNGSQFDVLLSNVRIRFGENGILILTAQEHKWDFSFHFVWVKDMKRKPVERHCQYSYRTIRDFFRGIKSPCVHHWFMYEDTVPYKATMNTWFIKNY